MIFDIIWLVKKKQHKRKINLISIFLRILWLCTHTKYQQKQNKQQYNLLVNHNSTDSLILRVIWRIPISWHIHIYTVSSYLLILNSLTEYNQFSVGKYPILKMSAPSFRGLVRNKCLCEYESKCWQGPATLESSVKPWDPNGMHVFWGV